LSEASFCRRRSCSASRGKPKAKLLGGFSLVRFFVPHKEMNSSVLLRTPQ